MSEEVIGQCELSAGLNAIPSPLRYFTQLSCKYSVHPNFDSNILVILQVPKAMKLVNTLVIYYFTI